MSAASKLDRISLGSGAGLITRVRRGAAMAGAGLAALMLMMSPVLAQQTPPRAASAAVQSHAHVYLMRGLMNIFSLGMDELAAKIRARGIEASVHNHMDANAIVAQITAKYRAGDRGPVILIGHSLGADAVMEMARSLDRNGVPVALVIPFDGTTSFAAPKNVGSVVNLTQREYAYMRGGKGFHGALENIDVSNDPSIGHITIDKSPRMQAIALAHVLSVVGGARRHAPTSTATARPHAKSATAKPLPRHVEAPASAAGPL